ncbi:protein AF-9 [Bicyclus anynana]|uniref:Protein AF-9 n=1 Tax=Bicyclus anynana TaxID=110368 RepID=A0A6J1NUB3_BICAN|nr:protein AF-9 [Bicyclus anynana]XP_023946946.1 protein AF-9 [Bicyclus anynana]
MSTRIRVNFEIGHEVSIKSKKTPEGFTHDWEVFVRGQEGADISHFVDKVVFLLHETFPKPRRVVKDPPFHIKESGYAGFLFPIEIYLKNKDDPKKIKFSYDLNLQQSAFLRDRYIFQNPNDEFRKKLLKGGGIIMSNDTFYTNPDQECKSRDSFTDEKPQLVSKPKLSSDNGKKHKVKEYKDEQPHRTSSFENLFGAPIHKPPKVSPEPKKLEKTAAPVKSEKKDKERSSSDKKSKHEHKESKPDKVKVKEEKDKQKSDRVKNHNKEQERTKEKSSKRQNERPPSPDQIKKRCLSPNRKVPSPLPRSSSASSMKEEHKNTKHTLESFEQKKPKTEERIADVKVEKDKEKKKKEKKSHDRDKERKEKKEHKKESHKTKDSPKEPKELPKEIPKPRDIVKEKETVKDSPIKDKQVRPEKPINKFSIENLTKTPPPENVDRHEGHKSKDKGDSERKHKHKKKDKKRDESKEKHKESSKEKKHKHEKVREMPPEKVEIIEHRETPVPKERPIPEPASPISIDTASQCSSKSGLNKAIHIAEDNNSSHSDSEGSMIADEEDVKVKVENPSPKLKREPSPEPEPELEPEPEPEPEQEPDVEMEPEPKPAVEAPPVQQKEKTKKHKDKSKREEKRRRRKAVEEEDAENRKVAKVADSGPSNNETEHGESSGSTSMETKVQDNGVSSSLGEDAEPGDLSPDYMVQLRDLQQRIMMIKNNEELERVVNLIAETGRYEVTTQTFDFDLCLLDRSTVQQLIQLVGC